MKQLLWKEWRELRFLPVGAAILCLILQIGLCVMCLMKIGGLGADDFTLSDVQGIAWGLWVFFATLAGAGLISQEVGNGTLSFLFALPTSRRQIWLVKVAVGVASLLLCIVSTAIVSMIVGLAAHTESSQGMNGLGAILFSSDSADVILCAFGCFAVSIAISPLLDRYISAAALSVGISLVIAIVMALGTTGYDTPGSPAGAILQDRVCYAMVWISIPLFAVVSYWTFTHGETLRSLKRFYAAGRAAILGLVAFLVLFLFARDFVIAQSAPALRLEEPYVATNPAGSSSRLTLFINRETDSQGHEQYIVQPSYPDAIFRLKMDWKVDGGQVGGSSNPTALSNGPAHISAWVDSDQDMLVKSVLSAQGMAISHPGNVTFGLNVIGSGKSFTPLTLYFKHGGWSSNSNDLPIDTNQPYKLGQKLTILDEIFTDNSGKGKSLDLQHVPNDLSSEALFKSGAAHRITVTATFEPAK